MTTPDTRGQILPKCASSASRLTWKGGDPTPGGSCMVSARSIVLATFAILLPAVAAAQDSVT